MQLLGIIDVIIDAFLHCDCTSQEEMDLSSPKESNGLEQQGLGDPGQWH